MRIDRRRFLKSGLAAAAITPFGWRPGILGANDKLRVGCIGVGGRGEGNVNGVQNENIVALCDVDRGRLAKQAERFKSARTFVDYREMFHEVPMDAVVIATPDHHHAPAAVRALRRGIHVYCEKPLTHTVEEARLLTRLARERGLVTQLGTQNHHHPVSLEAWELLDSGVIGAVREVHVITDRPGTWWSQGQSRPADTPMPPKDLEWDLWLGPAPVRPYHPAYAHFHWRGWWDFGCGAVGDMAIHLMDLAVYSLALDNPVKVSARGSEPMPESGPTWMIATFEYAARGKRPPCTVYWYEGEAKPAPEIAKELPMNGSLFIGDLGRLAVNHCHSTTLYPEERFKDVKKPESKPQVGHHANWLDAIRTGGKSNCGFDYAGPFTEQVLLANVAFRLQRPVYWQPETMVAIDAPAAAPLIAKSYRDGWGIH